MFSEGGVIIFAFLSFAAFTYDEWFGIRDFLDYFWIYLLGCFCATLNEKTDFGMNSVVSLILFVASIIAFTFMKESRGVPRELLGMLIAILMTASVVALCKSFEDRMVIPSKSPLSQTFTIFILSWPCQLVSEVVTERLLGLPAAVIMPTMLISGLLGPIIIIKLIDFFESKTNTKTLSFLLGR